MTKNYEIAIKEDRKNHFYVDLHVDYSYEEITGSSGLELERHFYICQGDDGFPFKLESRSRSAERFPQA